MSSWVFPDMQAVHIRMNSSLSPPKKILDPPMAPNSVSTSTGLCVTSNMKSTPHKDGKRHFHFWSFSKYKTWKEKVRGDMAYYIPPLWKNGGYTSPVSLTKLRAWVKLTQFCVRFIVLWTKRKLSNTAKLSVLHRSLFRSLPIAMAMNLGLWPKGY